MPSALCTVRLTRRHAGRARFCGCRSDASTVYFVVTVSLSPVLLVPVSFAHANRGAVTAFMVAVLQNQALLGSTGLLPVCPYVSSMRQRFGGPNATAVELYQHAPTLMWWLGCSDVLLHGLAVTGAGLSAFVALSGRANVVVMGTLWALYLSLYKVGQTWYSFGASCAAAASTCALRLVVRCDAACLCLACRLGVAAVGERLLGHLRSASPVSVAVPATHADAMGCRVGQPVARVPHHARIGAAGGRG